MTGNLYSFCSHTILDSLIIYSSCLSVFISVWTIGAIITNNYYSPKVVTSVFSRKSFDSVESALIGASSVLITLLIGLNLMTIRSHTPWQYNPGSFNGLTNSIDIIGRQWYWVYDASYNNNESVDSYISSVVDCADNGLNLKLGGVYGLNITSADVLHSFALPAANLKVDAVPGRINNVFLSANVGGRHVGYCSEFCGAGHSYMPIVVNVT
uniref:cytochrome-c oxidase n=1 Tax=Heterobothrium okamotoi TaxID=263722 RepID=A0A7U0M8A1_9PLAT|nr:cytochrome c oxidase subunit II [Heterobothrium okamotoi]QQX28231.1 cytochrome c oxidase subunit II [Heterobothrium okamotoi]